MSGDPAREQSEGRSRAWADQRTAVAAAQAARLERAEARESAEAAEMLRAFVRRAARQGPPPQPLHARAPSGHVHRTPLVGWYLRRDRSAAVADDGLFYLLRSPGGLAARLRGVRPSPSAAPLVLGRGGRDGDSVDLADALERVLSGRGR